MKPWHGGHLLCATSLLWESEGPILAQAIRPYHSISGLHSIRGSFFYAPLFFASSDNAAALSEFGMVG